MRSNSAPKHWLTMFFTKGCGAPSKPRKTKMPPCWTHLKILWSKHSKSGDFYNMSLSPLTFSLFFALAGAIIIGIVWLLRVVRRRQILRDLNMRLLLVRLPAENEDVKEKEALGDINKTSQLLTLLAKPGNPLVLEVAVHNVGEEISFYVAVPKKMVEFAMRGIQGLWNDAQVDAAPDDYTIFNAQGDSQAAYLKLKNHFALPIR